ncbi:hypothetical protein [Pseudomonas sp. MN1F]|uniref:hypothetical protein n=1 Tax=Pseudomonas sp. MN1F TaxID=1366632 RepID=UPI00128EF143|nr:hypothetical protein [Pseudomonas sp. MN1F]MQG92830.1 hypothetical protein [Pseudomonas sp. MN1F]
MSNLPELEALILNLVGSGITHSMLRDLVATQAPQVSRQALDAALVELQFSGALRQLQSEEGCIWAMGPMEEELFEHINPDVLEQILNPGEFIELDVDQLLAELDAMIVRARKK